MPLPRIPIPALILTACILSVWSVPGLAQHQHQPGMVMPGDEKPAGGAAPGGQAAPQGPPTVTIGPDKIKLIGAHTVPATRRAMTRVIRTVGRVEPDERRQAFVTVKVEGFVERLQADYTGIQVAKGQTLAEIYSPEIMAVQLEVLSLLKWRAGSSAAASTDSPAGQAQAMARGDAQALLEAAKQRLNLLDAGAGLLKGLQRTGKTTRTMAVTSPIGGTVTAKNVVLGQRVMPGDKLFEIVDLSSLWVQAEVYEYELPFIQLGQKAQITLNAIPDRTFDAKLDFIAPTLTPETRTAKLRFVLDNPKGLIKPMMYAEVELLSSLGQRLSVPDTAVIDTGERQIVYVEEQPGTFSLREVKVGARAAGLAEITSGLKEGEKVAASANFLIDSETRLSGGGGTGHQH